MSRVDKINSLLLQELAKQIALKVTLPDSLITISYVECSPDLRTAKVGVSVLPENHSGSALKKLRQEQKNISASLRKQLNLKFIPNFNWQIDEREGRAAKLEQALKELKQ